MEPPNPCLQVNARPLVLGCVSKESEARSTKPLLLALALRLPEVLPQGAGGWKGAVTVAAPHRAVLVGDHVCDLIRL